MIFRLRIIVLAALAAVALQSLGALVPHFAPDANSIVDTDPPASVAMESSDAALANESDNPMRLGASLQDECCNFLALSRDGTIVIRPREKQVKTDSAPTVLAHSLPPPHRPPRA